MKISIITSILSAILFTSSFAQQGNYLTMRWKDVATKMPEDWYGSEEAKDVAENILLYQKDIGGWEKNKEYHKPLSDAEKAKIKSEKSKIGGTFDNDATITELRFLAKVYAHQLDERYKKAFEKGLNYIFTAQYDNGGWPQFYPVRGGSTDYSGQITYNDNAMVNTMKFLQEIYSDNPKFSALDLSPEVIEQAMQSFDAGIQCMLNTQIVVSGEPTVWCAQHDEKTLAPAKARAYELPSFSGSESVGIAYLLMSLENPSDEVIAAVNGAAKWFEAHKVEGIKIETEIDEEGRKNRIVVEDKDAPALWARFYDLETEEPIFVDRDGIKKSSLAEIGYERRNGYSWYVNSPEKLLSIYPAWKMRISENN